MKKKCSCKGLKPSCYKCDGTGYYDVEKPRTTNSVWPWIQKPPKTIVINTNNPRKKKQEPNKNIFIHCPQCKASVRNDRLERHIRKVHKASSAEPNNLILSEEFQEDKSGRYAILAPVDPDYLIKAVDSVYPRFKKVSFGADNIGEMRIIRDEFLEATKSQGNVNVYIYRSGIIRYKAVLIDEFKFYNMITRHPDDWGSWNKKFYSYYTVKNLEGCFLPLNKFKSFLTGKIIERVRRPLRVYEP